MTHADSRPRIHLWPVSPVYWTYSLGPTAMRQGGGASPGEQLDRALTHLRPDIARKGVVVIIEAVT